MDKYTYGIKADKIQKLVKKGDYEAAVKVAETVDWEEVHSVRLLTITAAAYENVRDYKSAIELLQIAYEESAVGKRILYKLTGLAIADQDAPLAQRYYEMYLQEAQDDNGRYLLRYLLAELKKEPLDKRIAILETYRKYEFEEEWALRLAQLYDEAGMGDACVKLCDEIILWFGVGEYVDEALALKEKYAPLSAQQKEHRDNKEYYEQRYKEVVQEYTGREEALAAMERKADGSEKSFTASGLEEPWRAHIQLIEAEKLDEAVPKALEKLSAYYKKAGQPMAKLTRITAERFNQIGLQAAKAHIAGKDLLVDNAASLSDNLLSDLVSCVREEGYPNIFVLADEPEQLTYLDSRLGEYVEAEEFIPVIEVTEPDAEDVHLNVSEVMNDEGTEEAPHTEAKELEAPADTRNIGLTPAEEEPAPEEKEEPEEAEKAEEPAPAKEEPEEAAEEAAEEKNGEEPTEEMPEEQPAEDKGSAEENEAVLPEEPVEIGEDEQWTIAAFLKAQSAESAEKRQAVKNEAEALIQKVGADFEERAAKAEEERKALEAELKRQAEERAAEEAARKAEEEARAAEEAAARAAEEAARKAEEEARRAEEEARAAEEAARKAAEEEARKAEEEARKAAEEAARKAEEEARKAAEEAARKAEEEARTAREAEIRAAEEAARKAEEEARAAEEAAKAAAEEAARKAAQARAAAEAARAAAEEEQKRLEEEKAREAAMFEEVDLTFPGSLTAEIDRPLKEDIKAEKELFEELPEEPEEDIRIRESVPDIVIEKEPEPEKEEQPKEDLQQTKRIQVNLSDTQKQRLAGDTKIFSKVGTATGKIGAIGMTEEAFINYAKNYLTSIDCVLDEAGDIALQNAAEKRIESGAVLTKEAAENMIEDAADLAEKKGGLFARRYDKNGCLILRSKYIK